MSTSVGPRCRCLSRCVTEAACGTDVRAMTFLEEESNMGQFYVAINVDGFIWITMFKEKVDKFVKMSMRLRPLQVLMKFYSFENEHLERRKKGLERVFL